MLRMNIRRLLPTDAAAFQFLRLTGLREAPTAFSSSYEEECDTPLSNIEQLLGARNILGAFIDDKLAGIVSVGRETGLKTRHKAYIRAMYVAPQCRGTGAGRKLMQRAIAFVTTLEGVQQIDLAVTAGNAPAIALYESLGFKAYGLLPRTIIVDGIAYDEIPMSLLL